VRSSLFVVVILVLYLVNMLPIDGRAKQIVDVIVIGIISLLKISHRLLSFVRRQQPGFWWNAT
jgi:hypothetical protein